MQFGFSHHPREHHERHIWLVREAERLGYEFAWVPDQTFHRDPYVMLAAIGQATERIILGLAVTNPYTRHPAVTARAIGTVEEFAPGRVVLGVGAGNPREVVRALGLADGHVAQRCEEMIRIVRGLLAGEEVNVTGAHFTLDGVRLSFDVPAQIPLYIAGRGRHVLRAAGRSADGVIIGAMATPQAFEYALSHVRHGAQAADRSVNDMDLVSWIGCEVTDDRTSGLERRKPVIAHVVGGAPMEALLGAGLPEATAARIKDAYHERDSAYAAQFVTEECVDTFSIVGGPQYCRERIEALADAGARQFSVNLPQGGSVEEHRGRLEAFAEAVFPLRAGPSAGGTEAMYS